MVVGMAEVRVNDKGPTQKQYRVLNPDGTLVVNAPVRMPADLVVQALRWMLLSRMYDEHAIAMRREGRWGRYPPLVGQEAAVVGTMLALDPKQDWLVPQYRELVACVHHGHPLERITAHYMGKGAHSRVPDGIKLVPLQVALAAQLQHAAGLAWGLRLQGRPGVVMTFIGDGGSSEGDFHEALNAAGVTKAPVVFVLQNNQWAISTPRSMQSAATSLSHRAAGYGLPGIEVDGNDLLAMYDVAVDAVQRAQRGEGPTLIEAVTYRMSLHNTTDDPSKYLDMEAFEEAKQRDPIDRVTAYLSGLGRWDGNRQQEMKTKLQAEIDEAVEKAIGFPGPQPADAYENVYAQPPERMQRQLAALLARSQS